MSAAKRLAATVALLSAATLPAVGQDYGPYGYGQGYGFDWDGFYAGVYGGGVPLGTESINAGIFTGVNITFGSMLLGAEAQLGLDFEESTSLDALVLAKGGMTLGDALIYGVGGGGIVSGGAGYAFGGGAEYGFTDYLSVRGEVLGTGAWGSGPSDLRITAGLAFHM